MLRERVEHQGVKVTGDGRRFMICILYQTYYDGQMEKDELGVVCVTCERKTGMRAGKGLGVKCLLEWFSEREFGGGIMIGFIWQTK
jgi:hypothetical protein